jgi:hypothetical protein
VKRIIAGLCAVCIAMMFAGCTLVVENETQVKAHNSLTDLDVDVGGTTTTVDAIDLVNVAIGDVTFASIPGGTTTSPKATTRSGGVSIDIAEADVIVMVLGAPVTRKFYDIDPMTTTIEKGTTNTVEFNGTTAGVIFSALAKKKK